MSLRRRTATGNEILSGGAHKLYDSTGQNEDGSMTQKAVTDAIKEGNNNTFVGTMAEWTALTAEEKEEYELVNITDDGETMNDSGWILLNQTYGCYYRKIGYICYIYMKYDNFISEESISLGTLPNIYRPSNQMSIRNYLGDDFLRIHTNGQVVIFGKNDGWINIITSYPVGIA